VFIMRLIAAGVQECTCVGATVAGAVRWLDALRAAEPFAVVVQKACEVMEPTILSVVATCSLQKLELFGDHRQLPAFVHKDWFIAERSVKTSLFERLVSRSNVWSWTVLSKQ